ncbi:hypothetical protein STSP2_03549 [Anaerohalosphaera lusitana]|uniref:DUF362 domain-containing protein n=1 Tax=Anaerohalosphaera lusitana TaxID=1936003 RepID=A0A1U9NR04_9BACT|nr:DUF362 domain-containing protein [Anaerohalosphaera lusitana]AQT70343.1 hypothetical protein STSP2_03549 [Anaerohalosphaera lusitana]
MSKVAVIKTTPDTILDDVKRLMDMADVSSALDSSATTILKNNISWHLMYPSANTTPWQLEGTIQGLQKAGFDDLVCVENETVVTSAKKGEMYNKQRPVCEHYDVPIKYNFKPADMKWTTYQPKADMLVLDDIFPEGIRIPDYFHGKNVVHLPTVKCHIYTNMTGAMKNAFGGLLSNRRHYCHSKIHETLVDLLAIQKEIHPGIFTVMDGTTAGNGPGPRTMIPLRKDVLLASDDCVAIDAVSASLMGFEPMDHKFIRLAHERGLGTGRLDEIEIIGDFDVKNTDWQFSTGDNAASSVGKLFWFGPMKWLQRLMFHTPIVYMFIFASAVYHDKIWYPKEGKKVVKDWLENSEWGKMFQDYEPGK